jgi:hypothetical protein
MQVFLAGKLTRVFQGILKIASVLYQFSTQRPHGRVFLVTVSMGNNNHASQTRAACGEGDTLAVVAARCGDHSRDPWFPLLQLFEIDDAAPHFECAGGSVIFVFYPNIGADARGEQGPLDLGRWGNDMVYEAGGVL